MKKISASKLAEILDFKGNLIDADIERVETDSRKIQKGDLFIAIRGEKFDGHNFVKQVIEAGANLVIVEELIDGVDKNRQIVVENSLKAFGKIGAYNRSLFNGKVIGLTGSAGKTTTKEEIKFALEQFGKVYATKGNFNNNVGVPITLCDIDFDADYAVIEMGMSAKGEIEELVDYVKPDIAIITNVYPMHIEFFNEFKEIAEAKAEIFKSLKKGGTAIINQDTDFADILEKRALENGAKVIKFGKENHINTELKLDDEAEHNFYNAWCVLALINELKLDIEKTAQRLSSFKALAGRGAKHLLNLANGGKYTLIDDSYSGQPEAMKIAIKSLNDMKTQGRKIAVLGKMAELGDTSKAQHIEIGKVVANTDIDIVIGVCEEMKDMLAQVGDDKEKHYFDNKDRLDEFLLNKCLQNNDIVLIKGARYSSKLYQVTEKLLEKGVA